MNVYSRTLPLPGAVRPVREHGASAQDRAITAWPPPRPTARESHAWGAPVGPTVVRSVVAPWPAPDPVMRFDLPAPDVRRTIAPIELPAPGADLVEPRHPDLHSVSLAALAPPSIGTASLAVWPAPAPEDMAPAMGDRNRITPRLVIGLAAAVGALVAGAATLVSLL